MIGTIKIVILYLFCMAIICIKGQVLAPPKIPSQVRNVPEVRSFYFLWEFAMEVDAGVPFNRITASNSVGAPRTLMIPTEFSMANLSPQDTDHPLYLNDPSNANLRGIFVNSHLIDELVLPSDPELEGEGRLIKTLSDDEVLFQKDKNGRIFINDIDVVDTIALKDGTQIYLLSRPLFDLDKKVRQAFATLHRIDEEEPVGPPLDIPGSLNPPPLPEEEGRNPSGLAKGPQPPAAPVGIFPPGDVALISAPAPPPHFGEGSPRRIVENPKPVAVGPPGSPPGTLIHDEIVEPPAGSGRILRKETHSRVDMAAFRDI